MCSAAAVQPMRKVLFAVPARPHPERPVTQATRPRRPPDKIYYLLKRQRLCDPFNHLCEVPPEHELLKRCWSRDPVDRLVEVPSKRELLKQPRPCDPFNRPFEIPSEHDLLRCRPRDPVDSLIQPTSKRELLKRHRSCDIARSKILFTMGC